MLVPLLRMCRRLFVPTLRVAARLASVCLLLSLGNSASFATPANRAALVKYYGTFLPARLNSCSLCHLPRANAAPPISLLDFPHNAFGKRLALAAGELRKVGKKTDIASRIRLIAHEDSDGDSIDNQTELLLGHAPGDAADRPTPAELTHKSAQEAAFGRFLAAYRWQPFEPVKRPAVPSAAGKTWVRNPIDAFLAREHDARHLRPRPPATRAVLLRRVYLDLIGLVPTPDELSAFEADTAPNAYEKVVDRLLASPRYGERWGRHWMDVWRYSDWAGWADGNQIRDSKPFIWRWRDWIVEALNGDKGYDRMAQEMLAADELCPNDTDALRATGFLVRNFKLLSREQWMEDTLNHTSRAFLGLTLHCAKCHNHIYDPIAQEEYYRMRAIFEPHNVRTDRIPGQADVSKDGLAHVFDAEPDAPTYLFIRGDERSPDKSRRLEPGVPEALGGKFDIQPVVLPHAVTCPDRREFVVNETIVASEQAVAAVRAVVDKAAPADRSLALRNLAATQSAHATLLAVLRVEQLEDAGKKDTPEWKQAAAAAVTRQREQTVKAAEYNVAAARVALAVAQTTSALSPAVASDKPDGSAKSPDSTPAADGKADAIAMKLKEAQAKADVAEQALTAALTAQKAPSSTAYQPRNLATYPARSTGRRLAFARWLTDAQNPLTARVAVNQIWMRHFGQGIVPSVDNFGANGRPPSHPQLLDWLASEFMANGWRMKPLHRLIVTSAAYRMASTPDAANARIDPDNIYLWRMNSRRMEAELVRDNLLYAAGTLDERMGGPEIDHNLGLTSRRRSLYLRTAAEKQSEFLQIFDNASVTECYERKPSVMPQQALALANSELAIAQARALAKTLSAQAGSDNGRFINAAFLRVLSRRPTAQEQQACLDFLQQPTRKPIAVGAAQAETATQRVREHLVLVLFNHNDFVTIR